MTRHSKGIAWQGDGQQRKGIDELSLAMAMRRMGMKRDAENSKGIARAQQGHCIAAHGQA
nr:MAG TPA: hypothetical protein [Caudoviricetes sp.]